MGRWVDTSLQMLGTAELRHEAARDEFWLCLSEYSRLYPRDKPDEVRVRAIAQQVTAANSLANGDYLELGVHRGLTLKVIHRYMDKSRVLYGFDTFAGFDERDIAAERDVNTHRWSVGGFDATSVFDVLDYLGRPPDVDLICGWLPDAFRGFEDLRWRLVHVDLDLHQPTAAMLRLLWPRMVPGGIMMVHDYGCPAFQVKRAVDEFCAEMGVPPVELPDRYVSAVIRKPF